MEAKNNETQKENTFTLDIFFKIDVPKNFKDSVFNSIILGLSEYKAQENMEWYDNKKEKIKIQNDLLMRLQREIEQLIVKVEA